MKSMYNIDFLFNADLRHHKTNFEQIGFLLQKEITIEDVRKMQEENDCEYALEDLKTIISED